MTPDPSRPTGGGIANPLSWNRYAYTRGDPVNFADPSGLEDCPAPCYSTTTTEWMLRPGGPGGIGSGHVYLTLVLVAEGEFDGDGGGRSLPIGYAGAKADLANSDCYKFLGFSSAGAAQQAFSSVTFQAQSLGQLQIQDVGGRAQIVKNPPAQTAGNIVTINTDYNWFDFSHVQAQNITSGQQQTFDHLGAWNQALGASMTTSQFANLVLLHEFRHTDLGGSAPQETDIDFNKNIFKHCIR